MTIGIKQGDQGAMFLICDYVRLICKTSLLMHVGANIYTNDKS